MRGDWEKGDWLTDEDSGEDRGILGQQCGRVAALKPTCHYLSSGLPFLSVGWKSRQQGKEEGVTSEHGQ